MSREKIVERLAIVSYTCARSAAARQGVYASEWDKASNGMQDAHRNIAGRYLPEIERLLAAEREKVRAALSWALGELSDRGYSENIPKHDCGYSGNPEAGYCEFCDMWVKAQECLDLTAPSRAEE